MVNPLCYPSATICEQHFVISTHHCILTSVFLFDSRSLRLTVDFITPVAQLDLSGKSQNNVSPQTSNSICALVLIHWRSDSRRRGEIKTAVTQMNWPRRTIRMKNKKLFCSFVTCSNCCDTEETQSAIWSCCKWKERVGFRN